MSSPSLLVGRTVLVLHWQCNFNPVLIAHQYWKRTKSWGAIHHGNKVAAEACSRSFIWPPSLSPAKTFIDLCCCCYYYYYSITWCTHIQKTSDTGMHSMPMHSTQHLPWWCTGFSMDGHQYAGDHAPLSTPTVCRCGDVEDNRHSLCMIGKLVLKKAAHPLVKGLQCMAAGTSTAHVPLGSQFVCTVVLWCSNHSTLNVGGNRAKCTLHVPTNYCCHILCSRAAGWHTTTTHSSIPWPLCISLQHQLCLPMDTMGTTNPDQSCIQKYKSSQLLNPPLP